jgi:PTH1 family peptidyl-tRNA hydrolase
MSISHLIVGLGNPGEDYAATRHNIGFRVLDEIAARYGRPAWKKKFRGLITSSEKFLLLKPQTFMNLSGESAIEAMNFYELAPEQVIVFHDDLDLLPGQVKIKQGGGAAGHNGLKSLDAHISKDYWRIRLGIGRPMTEDGVAVKGDAVTNYVLNPFAKADKKWMEPLLAALADEFDLLLAGKNAEYLAQLPKAAN